MFDWKTIMLLSFVVLGLVVVLAHKEITKPKKAPRVEYKFMNINFERGQRPLVYLLMVSLPFGY